MHVSLIDRDRLPRALYRAEQTRHLDRIAIETHGIPGLELMNRAGRAAWRLIRARWPRVRTLTVLAGPGNNGGDGYVLARLAQAEGLKARVIQVGDPARIRGEAAASLEGWRAAGGAVESWGTLPRDAELIVDALLGTGLERPLDGPFAEAVRAINAHRAPVLSLDIPSGLHADTGVPLGVAVRATATLSFVGLKQGLFVGAGPEYRGEVHFSALDLPAMVYSAEVPSLRRIDWTLQAQELAPRSRIAHKGHFGHVLVVGGAPGMSGAVRLAGEGALRAGAGLVTIATHPDHAAWLNLNRPELMVAAVAAPADLEPLLARATAVAIGPGLGRAAWGRALWERVRGVPLPLVIDADALNLLAESPPTGDWYEPRPVSPTPASAPHPERTADPADAERGAARPGLSPTLGADRVLTPHPGEAARLLGTSVAEIEADRPRAARALQARYGGVAVLKGAGTLIQGPPRRRPPAVCDGGNPGLATAGVGDVLTGVVAALRAQGLEAEDAACAAVCLHAAAGDRAAATGGERGLIASDLLAQLRPVANRLAGRERRSDTAAGQSGEDSFAHLPHAAAAASSHDR